MRGLAAVVLGGVLSAGCVQPDPPGTYPIQFHCPRVGASITSSTGAVIRYGGHRFSDPEVCLVGRPDGQVTPMLYTWRPDTPPGADEFRRAMRRLFPLAPGKTTDFGFAGQDGQAWRHAITVVGLETVSVRAGQFQAWKVIEEERGFADNIHHSRRTYWIDSASWMPVKGEFELISGSWGPKPLRNWEAIKVIRP